MLEKIKHINSNGEEFDFTKHGIFIDYNNLRDYEWTYETINNRIIGFSKEIVTKTIPIIFSKSDINGKSIKDKIIEHFESDINKVLYGYFELNGYKFYCYCTAVKFTEYLINQRFARCELSFTSDVSYWIKEERFTFVSAATPTEGHDSKRYPHTYSYHYRPRIGQSVLYSQLSMPAHYQIIIYGPVTNPSISIGSNVYQVSVELLANEYLVIDYSNTGTRTITVYHQDGQSEDKFGARSKQFSVFTKIQPGRQPVLWSGDFAFDIVLFDERSQPKWI